MLDRHYVYVENEWVQWDESKMEFENIEESPEGHDVITFKYNNKIYKSKVIRK
jgi:hypothetical protein